MLEKDMVTNSVRNNCRNLP